MIGLGVGIDYALFIVTRHRQLLHDGLDVRRTPPAPAIATSGSAVVFAGTTVVIAILGLLRRRHPDGRRRWASRPAVTVAVDGGRRRSRCCPRCSASPGTAIDRLPRPGHRRASPKPTERTTSRARWARPRRPPPVALRIAGLAVLLCARRSRCSHAHSACRRRHAQPTRPTQRGPTTCWPRASAPASTGPLMLVVDLPAARADRAAGRS